MPGKTNNPFKQWANVRDFTKENNQLPVST